MKEAHSYFDVTILWEQTSLSSLDESPFLICYKARIKFGNNFGRRTQLRVSFSFLGPLVTSWQKFAWDSTPQTSYVSFSDSRFLKKGI